MDQEESEQREYDIYVSTRKIYEIMNSACRHDCNTSMLTLTIPQEKLWNFSEEMVRIIVNTQWANDITNRFMKGLINARN